MVNMALPVGVTLHSITPLSLETCHLTTVSFFSFVGKKWPRMQWAEPLTGSLSMPALGAKNQKGKIYLRTAVVFGLNTSYQAISLNGSNAAYCDSSIRPTQKALKFSVLYPMSERACGVSSAKRLPTSKMPTNNMADSKSAPNAPLRCCNWQRCLLWHAWVERPWKCGYA